MWFPPDEHGKMLETQNISGMTKKQLRPYLFQAFANFQKTSGKTGKAKKKGGAEACQGSEEQDNEDDDVGEEIWDFGFYARLILLMADNEFSERWLSSYNDGYSNRADIEARVDYRRSLFDLYVNKDVNVTMDSVKLRYEPADEDVSFNLDIHVAKAEDYALVTFPSFIDSASIQPSSKCRNRLNIFESNSPPRPNYHLHIVRSCRQVYLVRSRHQESHPSHRRIFVYDSVTSITSCLSLRPGMNQICVISNIKAIYLV